MRKVSQVGPHFFEERRRGRRLYVSHRCGGKGTMDEGKEVMTHDRRAILPVHPLEENRIGVTGLKGPDGDGRGAVARGYRTAAVAAWLVPGRASPNRRQTS